MKIFKNKTGFTLIELSIAMGILSLLFIGVFGFYSLYYQGLNTASNQVEIVGDAETVMYSLNDRVRNVPAATITIFGDGGTYISGRRLRVNDEEYYFEGYRYIENGTEVITNPGNDDYYRLVYNPDVFSVIQNSRILVNRTKKVIKPDSSYYQFFELDKLYSEVSVDSKRTNWITLLSLSNGVHGMAYGEFTNQIYILGGRRGGADLDEVWRFDPSTEVWSNLTPSSVNLSPMPITASGMSCCFYNNGIWVLGGGVNGAPSNKVMVYYPYPSGNNWVQDTSSGGDDIVSLPITTTYAGACMINLSETETPHIRIYVFGGFDVNDIGQTIVQAYDFNTHTWHQDTNNGGLLAPIPVGYGVGDIKADVINDKI
ncbi:MAG: kelch repeat-containing protein, partial [bacterium]